MRLTVVHNETYGEAVALLSADEARAFARMLTHMARDLELADRLADLYEGPKSARLGGAS